MDRVCNELVKRCIGIDMACRHSLSRAMRGGGLGSRLKKLYGERLVFGVEYHLMSPTPRR